MKLFSLPYAGASASIYHRWTTRLPHSVELRPLELAGRGERRHEKLATRLDEVAAEVALTIAGTVDGEPFAIFGHSLGALLAYEAAQALAAQHACMPVHLILSACRPPHAVQADTGRVSDLPEEDFRTAVARSGGLPAGLLEHARIFKKISGVLRADYALLETYVHRHKACCLPSSITAFSGEHDPEAPPAKMEGWAQYTAQAFRHHTLAGGHLFLLEHTDDILDRICAALDVPR